MMLPTLIELTVNRKLLQAEKSKWSDILGQMFTIQMLHSVKT